MTLPAGTRLGPYEIRVLLGAGGMGEVYRARDGRLGRDVAVKVLPAELGGDSERIARFEREARAASALSDPHIVAVFDVGHEKGIQYIASELVEGSDLRLQLGKGRMPIKKALELAEQIASGLAAAHEKGIVHRDLKPENVLITKSGLAKIADFGLAKQTETGGAGSSQLPTSDGHQTSDGVVMGTVAYMSPEQARGGKVDFRSDQFALGLILYEMLTGRQAFKKGSAPETLAAIIREEPEPILAVIPDVPAPVVWVVDRCLAKDPGDRYGSTRDAARDLAQIRAHASGIGGAASASVAPPANAGVRRRFLVPVLAAVAALLVGAVIGRRFALPSPASYSQVTFRRGSIVNARFAPDGETMVYGAAWEGRPFEIFSSRGSGVESRSLGYSSADVLAISKLGEMAILIRPTALGGFVYTGTLARADLSGGAPREILENVFEADWTPDGKDLAVVRPSPNGMTLELPPGRELFHTAGWISHARVSPRGDQVAFIHHPVSGDDRGEIMLCDRGGNARPISTGWSSVQGLAWGPAGREVWFTAAAADINRALYAVWPSGRSRLIARIPGGMMLRDISRSGRVLLTRDSLPVSLAVRPGGSDRELNLTWLDASILRDISPDGRTVVFTEAGQGGGTNCSVFLRRTSDPFAVRLGEGWAQGLSPDQKSVLAIVPLHPTKLVIYPVGAGSARTVEHPGIADEQWANFLPDGKRIVFSAREANRPPRIFVQDLSGGRPRPVTPEGVGGGFIEDSGIRLSPDGRFLAIRSLGAALNVYPIDGGLPRTVTGALPDEVPLGWSADGSSLFVSHAQEPIAHVFRLGISEARREKWNDLAPSDLAGVTSIGPIAISPDGRAYAYSCLRYLSELYIGEGLK